MSADQLHTISALACWVTSVSAYSRHLSSYILRFVPFRSSHKQSQRSSVSKHQATNAFKDKKTVCNSRVPRRQTDPLDGFTLQPAISIFRQANRTTFVRSSVFCFTSFFSILWFHSSSYVCFLHFPSCFHISITFFLVPSYDFTSPLLSRSVTASRYQWLSVEVLEIPLCLW
jgi:hypothetical protein